MKASRVVLLSGAVVLATVGPTWSQTAPSPRASSNAPMAAVDRDGYLRAVRLHMAHWRAKLADLGARTSSATTGAGKDAQTMVFEAWARVEAAASRLDAAGKSGWREAKAAYEHAGDGLDAAWSKFKPTKT